ncbi:phosphodiester glycosidase family protein [Citricoccus alkalitolerans]|uniref:Phosphodiester glycosidase family protein n=1 Tax=Citricoccus alkalitolerans TaxID=246603 RepID=A0ABV8XTH5_9MICC
MITSTRRTAARTLTITALSCALLTTGTVAGPVAATSDSSAPTADVSVTAEVSGAEREPAAGVGTFRSAGTEQRLALGVTHESLTLGNPGSEYSWTVQVTLPSGQTGVRDSHVSSRGTAHRVATELREAGLEARAGAVVADRLADAGGYLGHRVRVGAFRTEAEAEATRSELTALGYSGGTWYEGWDGDQPSSGPRGGPVNVEVLTIDPLRFKGEVTGTFGEDLERTETVSELADGALAGVNAGFFVYGEQHGAPGDPAGAAAYNGDILSETVGDRPNLVIDHRSGRASIQRLTWEGRISAGRQGLDLDGINRVPGKIRNCGGTDDLPTEAPKHDVTCTDADEIVVFTEEYGATTPEGDGLEVVVDRHGRVQEVTQERGTELADGQYSIQAIGEDTAPLDEFATEAGRIKLTNEYLDERGKKLRMTPHTQVLNGGPNLLTDGERDITASRDGMVHADNPGQFYGWTHQRNPRTIAGIDGRGQLVLITADGRQTDSVGLSISEAADLSGRLGLVDAINLDGGGSTAMVVDGELENSPSGGSERAVGDAIVIRER